MEKIKLPNGLECYSLSQRETEYIYSEIFSQQQYVQNNIVVREGDCIFDVGANIGLFVLYVNQLQKNLKVFAFEPVEPVFTALSNNIELHNLTNVSLFKYGFGSENAPERVFVFYPNMPGNSTERPKEKLSQRQVMIEAIGQEQTDYFFQNTQVSGEVRTLSRAIEELSIDSIDLLKIDVEGEELAVIQGIKPEDWIKVKQVVAEVHDIDNRLDRFQSLLKNYGFEVTSEKNPLLPATLNNFNVYAVRQY
jgi:FkbM family methyltransferase